MNGKGITAFRLFLLGFLTLFLELTFIRYLAGSVWNLGFFPNLVLLGAFLGMGTGFVFHNLIPEKRSPWFFRLAAVAILVLVGFVYWKHPAVPRFTNWAGTVGGEVFFTNTPPEARDVNYLPFALIFLLVAVTFFLTSQRTAKYFRLFAPLTAYTLDILGSCGGILAFMLISWLQVPAYLWFLFLILLFSVILESSRWQIPLILGGAVVLVWLSDQRLLGNPAYDGPLEVHWSPYQKVELATTSEGMEAIYVNGISHQAMMTAEQVEQSMYCLPYLYREHFGKSASDDVLVIGAGSGNDVAAALSKGVKHVDAVEIDPVIAAIGRRKHPMRPYADPRVTQVIDDGRAFMAYTPRKYDVIVFALTDSLVKVSPMAQLRLENYIFTQESVDRAFSLLKDGGNIFFYNYYRTPWVMDKIKQMACAAAGVWPQTVFQSDDLAMFAVDPLRPGSKPPDMGHQPEVPSDDWPFLYLKDRGIPPFYAKALGGVIALVFLLSLLVHWTMPGDSNEAGGRVKLAFLLMGTAFLLLEAKSVIQFSLLFGTTWLNNSLVFLAVLLFVLAANWVATLVSGSRVVWITYVLLMAFCLAAFLYPLGRLLAVQSVAARFVAASVLTFSPIFFANIIFSVTFRQRKVAEHLFGWNLMGAAHGRDSRVFQHATWLQRSGRPGGDLLHGRVHSAPKRAARSEPGVAGFRNSRRAVKQGTFSGISAKQARIPRGGGVVRNRNRGAASRSTDRRSEADQTGKAGAVVFPRDFPRVVPNRIVRWRPVRPGRR